MDGFMDGLFSSALLSFFFFFGAKHHQKRKGRVARVHCLIKCSSYTYYLFMISYPYVYMDVLFMIG